MADFYFFADYDLFEPQASSEAFNNSNLYSAHSLDVYHDINGLEKYHPQTTAFFGGLPTNPISGVISPHKSSGAYAICDGRVFVFRDSSGANKDLKLTSGPSYQQTVAIVLQPSVQPATGLPKIKYFIYRGVLLESLVWTSGEIITDGRNGSHIRPFYNNLTTRILDADEAGNLDPSNQPNQPNAFANALDKDYGINSSSTFIKSLDDIFFRDNESYQLFNVKGGDSIGFFNQFNAGPANETKIRIGVIFDAVGYHPTIDQILGNKNQSLASYEISYNYNNKDFINSQALSNYKYAGTEDIKNNFLDPCAFYGSFAYNDRDHLYARKFTDSFVSIPRSTSAYPLKGRPVYTRQSSNELYENILSNFYNKNRIYLDIRNPENKQLNFYDNYSKYIKLKIKDSSKLPPNNVFASFSDIKANDPSKTNKTYLTLDPGFFDSGTAPNNEFEIALPDGKEVPFTYGGKNYSYINNETPSVWVENCFVSNQFPANLFGATNFIRNFSRNKDKAGYSSSIHLSVKNYTDDLQKPFCTYIRINYLKESDTYIYPKGDKCCGQNPILPAAEHEICCGKSLKFPDPLIEPGPDIDKTIRSYEYLDNFFTPFGMLLPQATPNALPDGISSNIYYDPKYLDNTRIGGLRMMAYPGIAQDKIGTVTLFAVPADIRNPPRNIIESGISFSGVVSKGNDNLFIEYISKQFRPIKNAYKKVLLDKNDISESNDRLLELITFDKNIDTDVLNTVSAETLAWLTIEKNDFERLARINRSRGNDPYTDPITNVVHKSDFIDPAKTYLGLKLVSTGKAKDKNNGGAVTDYVKYEFILRNETLIPATDKIEFKSVSTGVCTYALRVEGPRITDKKFFPSLIGSGKPFTAEANANGGVSLKSTIYLLPDANITKEELWEYLQYIQCNIRQVWTNRSDINPDTGHPYNCGQYNVGLLYNSNNFIKIDAENIIVKVGTAVQASSLMPGECAFRVRKKGAAVTFTRSFAMGGQHVGVLFYAPINGGRTRYAEDGDNTPAHEFGHLMGLSDRYTSTGVVDTSDNKMVGPLEGNKPAFMDDGPSFDPEYTTNYNWVYNLYSTGAMLKPLPLPEPISKLASGRESAFDAFRNDPTLVPMFPTNETPARYGRICTFITSKQWNIINDYASGTGPSEASLNPALSNSDYVFFKDLKVTPPAGSPGNNLVDVSFIGFSFNTSPKSAVSDLLYQPAGTLSPDGMMRNRIGTDNSIVGYFSPYAGTLSLDRNTVENDPQEMANVERSGFIGLKKIIEQLPAGRIGAEIQNILPDYDGVSKKIDLTVLDPFKNYGDGDAVGRKIWNYSDSNPITEKVGSYTITYIRHPYRSAIIQRIQGKS